MNRRLIIYLITLTSIIMSLVFGAGLVNAVRIGQGTRQTNQESFNLELEEVDQASNLILVLGDSIGAGVGDQDNLGIEKRYLSLLSREQERQTTIENFAVPGAETGDLSLLLASGSVDKAIKDASLIILSIGGNNLNRINEPSTSQALVEYEEVLKTHQLDLSSSLTYIRQLNDSATILLLGIYNPYGSKIDNQNLGLLHRWNYETRVTLLSFDNIKMVPLYDRFEGHLGSLLSFDNFHPSGQGYQVIAELIYDIVSD